MREALAARGRQSPVHAFQTLMRALVEQKHPLFRITERPIQFWRAVAESPTLAAPARELQATLADDLAAMLADTLGRPHSDPDARLAAAMAMATLVVAYGEALRAFREDREPEAALVSVIERGFAGVNAALAGTPFV